MEMKREERTRVVKKGMSRFGDLKRRVLHNNQSVHKRSETGISKRASRKLPDTTVGTRGPTQHAELQATRGMCTQQWSLGTTCHLTT
jgi:hypothetical protein